MTLEGCSVEADIDGFIQAKSTGTEPPGEAWPAGSTAAGARPICPEEVWPQLSEALLPGRGRAAHGSPLGSGTVQSPGWVVACRRL